MLPSYEDFEEWNDETIFPVVWLQMPRNCLELHSEKSVDMITYKSENLGILPKRKEIGAVVKGSLGMWFRA